MTKENEMNRTEAEQLNEEGVQLLQEGKGQEALETFIKAIQHDDSFAFPFCHVGNILAASNHFEEAIDFFHQAIKRDEEMATAYYGLGNALFSMEKLEEAVVAFKQAEEKGLHNGDVYFMLGMCYKDQGDDYLTQALAYFQRALDMNPDDLEAIFHRGLCSAQLHHLDQAKKDFVHVINEQPDHADAHFNLGIAYIFEEDLQKAKQYLDKAIDIQPDHLLALNAKKHLEEVMGR